jgi:hypothetical protein
MVYVPWWFSCFTVLLTIAKKWSEILKRPRPVNPRSRRLVLISVPSVMRFAVKSPGSMPSSVVNGRFVTVWLSLMHYNYNSFLWHCFEYPYLTHYIVHKNLTGFVAWVQLDQSVAHIVQWLNTKSLKIEKRVLWITQQ